MKLLLYLINIKCNTMQNKNPQFLMMINTNIISEEINNNRVFKIVLSPPHSIFLLLDKTNKFQTKKTIQAFKLGNPLLPKEIIKKQDLFKVKTSILDNKIKSNNNFSNGNWNQMSNSSNNK